jgi:hypothetical protein
MKLLQTKHLTVTARASRTTKHERHEFDVALIITAIVGLIIWAVVTW